MVKKLKELNVINDELKSIYHYNEYTLTELLCKFGEHIQNISEQTNELEESYTYLLNEGLSKEVIEYITELLNTNQLEGLLTSEVFYSMINYEGDNKLQYLVDTYDRIIIDEDITLKNTVNINKNVQLISRNNSKIISGDFSAIKVKSTMEEYQVGSMNSKTITLLNVLGLKVGDTVLITSEKDYSIINTIGSINNNTIELDNINFSYPTTKLKFYKYNDVDCLIEGLVFQKVNGGSSKDITLDVCKNATIKNCKFINASGITIFRSPNILIDNNIFNNTGDSVFIFDSDFDVISNNVMNNISHGVRCAYVNEIDILNNKISNGKSKQYSIGIEVSGVNLDCYKSCYCRIIGNTVYNINVGVLGSASGGIHLNFRAHHNLIQSNIVKYNGIGIYLENYCESNTIDNNISSYNGGWYGVGIECDWNCHYNIITSNTCEYNIGDINAHESCGIEVRTGKNDEHEINNTVVNNNICRYNGLYGLYVHGRCSSVVGNSCENNGSLSNTESADIILGNIRDCTVSGNTIKNTLAVGSLILVNNGSSVVISNNVLVGGGNHKHSLRVENSDSIFVTSNSFSGASGRDRLIVFYSTTNIRNMMNSVVTTDNGYPCLEFNGCSHYLSKGNTQIGNNNTVVYQCTNPDEL